MRYVRRLQPRRFLVAQGHRERGYRILELRGLCRVDDRCRDTYCQSAPNNGSDAILMESGIDEPDHAGLQKVDFASAVHLALDQLELGDLPLGLSVRPG